MICLVACALHLAAVLLLKPATTRFDTAVTVAASGTALLGAVLAVMALFDLTVDAGPYAATANVLGLVAVAGAVAEKFFPALRAAGRFARRLTASSTR